MTKHPTEIPGVKLHELAQQLAGLRYDRLEYFLQCLAGALMNDAAADDKRGRPQLAAALSAAGNLTAMVATKIDHAWYICAAHEYRGEPPA